MVTSLREKPIDHESEDAPEPPPAPRGATVGVLVGLGADGEPWIDHPHNPTGRPLPARTTVPLAPAELGREVVLVFEADDPRRPLVLGVIQAAATASAAVATLDGERVVLTAEREIVLRCGEASLTLTRAGKILLRGRYVSSRSSGVNRILGGAVRIN